MPKRQVHILITFILCSKIALFHFIFRRQKPSCSIRHPNSFRTPARPYARSVLRVQNGITRVCDRSSLFRSSLIYNLVGLSLIAIKCEKKMRKIRIIIIFFESCWILLKICLQYFLNNANNWKFFNYFSGKFSRVKDNQLEIRSYHPYGFLVSTLDLLVVPQEKVLAI